MRKAIKHMSIKQRKRKFQKNSVNFINFGTVSTRVIARENTLMQSVKNLECAKVKQFVTKDTSDIAKYLRLRVEDLKKCAYKNQEPLYVMFYCKKLMHITLHNYMLSLALSYPLPSQ